MTIDINAYKWNIGKLTDIEIESESERNECIYSKELLGGAAGQTSVLNLVLFGQSLDVFNGRLKPFGGEKRGQIRRVRRDHDQSEEPPGTSENTSAYRFRIIVDAWSSAYSVHQQHHYQISC